MISVTVSKFWRSDVSHVIASTNENGACTRTLKVLMAISNGKWVLKLNYVRGFSRKQQTTCIMQPLRSGKLL
ncbi:hypothetical protein E1A91_A08G116800v1 [Gossypium mustelinum]|uniref:BRCT domain-containing protein n=1 Tax=Gossypium mustelinum TaxID=34275 RepID=A0A5D2Y943_GOSMU|nr:hypothetical protein E1A91_A08G116800v1 [Gossypium mustelinum]